MRPPEPDFVKAWREWVKNGPPRCCHTCNFYSVNGECGVFHVMPPKDFAEALDECEKWEPELPF
jgi:hypothetical protein